ncbi:hypothetical protein BC826DRAFT_1103452 [Russula brevipes]|nr:hypothetical protein BC826DRAFT_1103452 [Russula brevipes]
MTAVHITLNTQTVPHRKGVGNMPFIFRAYGTSRLDPPRPRSPSTSSPTQPTLPAPPPRIFPPYKRPRPTDPTSAVSANAKTTSLDRDAGPGDTEVDDSCSSDEDDFDGGLDTRIWNHTGAFPRFLSHIRARERSSSSSSSSSSASPSPSVPPSPSSPVRPSLCSSSPTAARGMRRAATVPYASCGSTSSAASLALSLPSCTVPDAAPPLSSPARSLPSLTPAPARVRTRYRVARAARRLLGLAERGLESAAAEEADVTDGCTDRARRAARGTGGRRGHVWRRMLQSQVETEDEDNNGRRGGGVESVHTSEGRMNPIVNT